MEQTKYQQIHLKEYGIYLAPYLAAIPCSEQEWYAASGVVLGLAGTLSLYPICKRIRKSGGFESPVFSFMGRRRGRLPV